MRILKNSTKCYICDNDDIDNDVKVRDHRYITETYRGSVHRDCNINLKLNHKIPALFHNQKSMIHILLCKSWANLILK